MSNKRLKKRFIVFLMSLSICINNMMFFSSSALAKEEYRLEFFSQLADKVTSLYFKEAIVGLDVLGEIYSDPLLSQNIQKEINKDIKMKLYLLERGFDSEKIKEIIGFLDKSFPNVEELGQSETTNIIEKLVKTTLIDEDATLSYMDYDEDIKSFGTELYKLMPKGVTEQFDTCFETEEEKRDAMIKIVVEYIYSGHGKATYNEETKEYIDLSLSVDDEFVENINSIFEIELLNENNKKAMNMILKGLEQTIKQREFDRVYSDLSSVLNLVETNFIKENRESNIEEDFKDTETSKDIKDIKQKLLNRAEIVKLTLTVIDIDTEEFLEEFSDVEEDDFYSDYISTGKSIGLINGYKDNTFRPKDKVTRSEMMSILSNTIEHVDGNVVLTSEETEELLMNIKYKDDIEPWARESVAKLIKSGIIEQDYSEKFGSEQLVSRDEVMSIIDMIESLKISN